MAIPGLIAVKTYQNDSIQILRFSSKKDAREYIKNVFGDYFPKESETWYESKNNPQISIAWIELPVVKAKSAVISRIDYTIIFYMKQAIDEALSGNWKPPLLDSFYARVAKELGHTYSVVQSAWNQYCKTEEYRSEWEMLAPKIYSIVGQNRSREPSLRESARDILKYYKNKEISLSAIAPDIILDTGVPYGTLNRQLKKIRESE